MRLYNWLMIATVSLMLTWAAACSNTSTRAARMTDEEIEKTVTARIEAVPNLQAYDIDVSADAEKSQVTLTGTVPSEAVRMEAVGAAKRSGIELTVVDKIEVNPGETARGDYTEDLARQQRQRATEAGESIGDSLDDAWIHTKVRAKLAGRGEMPFGGLNVDVMNNVVTLRGSVDSQEAKVEAERITKETEGVAKVVNKLVVKK